MSASADALRFPIFEANQVLTKDHLNDLFDYLHGEIHATRVHAIGRGVLAGLDAWQAPPGTLNVACGAGLTSAGWLIRCPDRAYRFATEFVDKGDYAPWDAPAHPIWLLSETPTDAASEAAEAANLAAHVADHVLVLYVEGDEEDLQFCSLEDCNDRGKEVRVTVRALLVHHGDLPAPVQPGAAVPAAAPVQVPRVTADVIGAAALEARFADACTQAIADLVANVPGAVQAVRARLGAWSFAEDPAVLEDGAALGARLGGLRDAWRGAGQVQACHDLLRDVAAAYNALLCEVAAMRFEDCADTAAHERHLCLREFPGSAPFAYRHRFVGPRAHHGEAPRRARVERLLRKLAGLLARADANALPVAGPSILPQDSPAPSGAVIPYYYRQPDTLRPVWAVDGCRQQHPAAWVRSARDGNAWQSVLGAGFDDQGFLRVEGVLAHPDVDRVVSDLEHWRRARNLAFDVWPVHFDTALSDDEREALCVHGGLASRYAHARGRLVDCLEALAALAGSLTSGCRAELGALQAEFADATRLVTSIRDFVRKLPGALHGFDADGARDEYEVLTDRIAEYRCAVVHFEDEALRGRVLAGDATRKPALTRGNPAFYVLLATLLSELRCRIDAVHCCHDAFCELLALRETLSRAETDSLHVFRNFQRRHPGLEHAAGVTRGGTFVLVYRSRADRRVVADYYLPYVCCTPCEDVAVVEVACFVPLFLQCAWEASIPLPLAPVGAGSHVQVKVKGAWKPLAGAVEIARGVELRRDEDRLVVASDPKSVPPFLPIKVQILGRGGARHRRWHHVHLCIRPPLLVPADDVAVTSDGKPVTIALTDNDVLPREELEFQYTKPAHGTIKELAPGIVAYTPHDGHTGHDDFDYAVTSARLGRSLRAEARVTVWTVPCCEAPTRPPERQPPKVELEDGPFCAGSGFKPFTVRDGVLAILGEDVYADVTATLRSRRVPYRQRVHIGQKAAIDTNARPLPPDARETDVVTLGESRYPLAALADVFPDLKPEQVRSMDLRYGFVPTKEGNRSVLVQHLDPSGNETRLRLRRQVVAPPADDVRLEATLLDDATVRVKFEHLDPGMAVGRYEYRWHFNGTLLSKEGADTVVVQDDRVAKREPIEVSGLVRFAGEKHCFTRIERMLDHPGRTFANPTPTWIVGTLEAIDFTPHVAIRVEQEKVRETAAAAARTYVSLVEDEGSRGKLHAGAFDEILIGKVDEAVERAVAGYRAHSSSADPDQENEGAKAIASMSLAASELALEIVESAESVTPQRIALAEKAGKSLELLASRGHPVDVELTRARLELIKSKPVRRRR